MKKPDSNGTLVKADIVELVYQRVGFTRHEATQAVEIIFDEIKTHLAQGENVRISRFASFILRKKNARSARNPKTGESIKISARTVLTFKPSKQLLASTDQNIYEDSSNSR